MENMNTGSFGSAIAPGAGSAVAEAMSRRNGQLNQNTQQPQTLPAIPPQGAAPAMPGQPPSQPSITPPGTPGLDSAEANMIIRALNDRLKTSSRIAEAGAGIMK